MPHFTFPITKDGCTLDVQIGLGAVEMRAAQAAGQPLLAPLGVRAVLDTGSDKTAVAVRLLQQLGTTPVGRARTHTATGRVRVRLYEVSLSVPNPTGARTPMLVRPQWRVPEFLHPPPDIAVLIGMDLVRECLWILDGPGGIFTLGF
jgi:hypothetical protein